MIDTKDTRKLKLETEIFLLNRGTWFEVYAGPNRLGTIEKIYDNATAEMIAYKALDKFFADLQKAVDYLIIEVLKNSINSSYSASISRMAIVKRTLWNFPYAYAEGIIVRNYAYGETPKDGEFSVCLVRNKYGNVDWKLVNKTGVVVFYSDQFLEECVLIPPGHEIILEGKSYYKKEGQTIIKKDKRSYPSAE